MAKAVAAPVGALAKARKFAQDKRKEEFDNVRVKMSLEDMNESLPHVSSGSVVVDHLIGGIANSFGVAPCPGFPRGRVSQLWGHESAGKTTLALSVAAQVCKEGGSVLYVDWENDIVPDYAMALGVPVTDENKFELLQPDNLEDGIKYALIYAAAGVDLIVFDSVGAAIPRRLTERDLNDAAEQGKVGEVQAVWSQELPNLKRLIARSGTAVIGISQIRAEIGKMGHGPQTKPQGGNAWKFYSSVRLELRRVQYENTKEMNTLTHKVEDKVSGSVVKVKAVKCKMSRSQGREEIFYLRGGYGIDNIRSILEIAIAHGMIKKAGAWITWVKPDGSAIKVQGVEKLRQHMVDTPADYAVLDSIVRPLLGSGESTKQFVEDEDYEPVVGEDEPATGGLSMDEELDGIFDSDT
jgi:recombination protein RecA